MSKPRDRWWGYVKAMIRNYPAVKGAICTGTALRERQAVESALEQTGKMESGPERLRVVELVFLQQTHTLEGAAMAIPCHYETAKRWVQQFIKLTAQYYGLRD